MRGRDLPSWRAWSGNAPGTEMSDDLPESLLHLGINTSCWRIGLGHRTSRGEKKGSFEETSRIVEALGPCLLDEAQNLIKRTYDPRNNAPRDPRYRASSKGTHRHE